MNINCLLCTTTLPVDSNSKTITCPKCGTTFDIAHLSTEFSNGRPRMFLSYQDSEEDEQTNND